MIIASRDRISINEDFKIAAGPGAGKTEFLVNHIKNVLENSDKLARTRKIACITYTNTAVETILERIGKSASDKIEESTIHSFLYRNIVKPFCPFIPTNYKLCSKKVKGHEDFYINRNYLIEWLECEDFNGLKHPNSRNQILKLPALYQALQNWLFSAKCIYENEIPIFKCDNQKAFGYDKSGKRMGLNKSCLDILSYKIISLKKIYWRKGKLDHNDILYFSFVLIKQYPFILEILRAKFPYMFIDEYQDTNPIQSFILNEMRKKETVVGVIGDKAQSIYSFQGAEPLLFESFKVNNNHNHTICNNYRSANQIVKLLNNIRNDIIQEPQGDMEDHEIIVLIGNRVMAYKRACDLCNHEPVVSLSRDNITSNAMKKDIDDKNLDKKLLERYNHADGNRNRRTYVISFISAIEAAQNGAFKESIKSLERIFKNDESPKKAALFSLMEVSRCYNDYCSRPLMKFYDVLCQRVKPNLAGFGKGAAKDFYENTSYKEIAICMDIMEDVSNHITIHKAKGAEYDNVLIVENKHLINFLLVPDLDNKEEHRVLYVAMSRAKKRLFLQLENLSQDEEEGIKTKFNYLHFIRL